MKPSDSQTKDADVPNAQVSGTTEIVVEPANPRRTSIDDLQGLARLITRVNPTGIVRFAYHEPRLGTYGVTLAEIIYIWLPRMTDAVEAAIVLEIGKAAITWARKRLRRRSKSPKIIYICAQDGRVLREIRLKDTSGDPEVIVPEMEERVGRARAPLRERACGNWRYVLILTKRFLKNTAVTVVQSPRKLISAILEQRRTRKQRRNLKLYEEQCNAVEIQKTLKRLVIEKIHPTYETRTKLKENVTYGSDNEAVQFETVFESEDGTPSKLVHIHYVRHGGRKEETRRYMEALAHFRGKIRDYERLTGRVVTIACVLIVPQEDKLRGPQIVWSLFPVGEGWVFSYKDLGYDERHARGNEAMEERGKGVSP